MKPIRDLTRKDLQKIKLIVFDVDGVLVPRGTKIRQEGSTTTLETKQIAEKQVEQMRELSRKGFLINISSGRGLYMLLEMFRDILPFASLTYENGSATWRRGGIYQHVNSFQYMKDVLPKLKRVESRSIKGFEPKEFIITVHCTKRVKKIEDIMSREKKLYAIWNGEAYDIGVKKRQTKAIGLRRLIRILNLDKKNVMAIGDNYNDSELLKESGMAVTADRSRLEGRFYVPLNGKLLPADKLMTQILSFYRT